jgi:RNA polymerase sigma-70 factor, ECF subfamily
MTEAHEAPTPRALEADPDIQLMLRARDGDTEAFGQLYSKYSRTAFVFAQGMIRNRSRAEELVHDAFMHIYKARARYTPRARFSTYLYRVMLNSCLNERRRRDLEHTVPEDGRPVADDSVPSAEAHVTGRDTLRKVQSVLKELPANQRNALLLARCEGLDYREVAEQLGVSQYAVKSLVFRATRTLRERCNPAETVAGASSVPLESEDMAA